MTCIKCGVPGGIWLELDGDTMHCQNCDGTFTADDVEALIGQWAAILPWLKSHPARTEAE